MTKGEREQLARLVRARARVAKAGVEGRQAELLADLEAQLAAEYPSDDPRWADIAAAAGRAVAEADAAVAAACRAADIREEFRPGLSVSWYKRGENAGRERRAELRAVGKTRIAALGKAAKLRIDQAALETETVLVAGALSTGEAKVFLESMPTVEALMPSLSLPELEAGEVTR